MNAKDGAEPDGYYSICGHPFWYGETLHRCEVADAALRDLLIPAPCPWWRFWR